MDEKIEALRREYMKYVDQELPKVPAQRGPIERWDQWLAAIVIRSREENAKLREAIETAKELMLDPNLPARKALTRVDRILSMATIPKGENKE
jgi:hypothetical protein